MKTKERKMTITRAFALSLVLLVSGATLSKAANDALRFRITSQDGYYDEAVVSFVEGATTCFDWNYDAWNLPNPYPYVPSIFTLTCDDYALSINGLPALHFDTKVELFTWLNDSGNYAIEIEHLGAFAPEVSIYMLDLLNGMVYDLNVVDSINLNFVANLDTTARFELYFSFPTDFITTDANCVESGSVIMTDTGSTGWSYVLEDENENLIQTGTNINETETITGLPGGEYHVDITTSYGVSEEYEFTINELEPVTPSISANENTVYLSDGGTVQFYNTTTGALDYQWDFGDGNTSTDFEPSHSYAEEGNYVVKMIASNGTCSDSTTIDIIVIDDVNTSVSSIEDSENAITFNHYNNEYHVSAKLGNQSDLMITVFSSTGQLIYSKTETNVLDRNIPLELENHATGIYIVKINTDDKTFAEKIFLSN